MILFSKISACCEGMDFIEYVSLLACLNYMLTEFLVEFHVIAVHASFFACIVGLIHCLNRMSVLKLRPMVWWSPLSSTSSPKGMYHAALTASANLILPAHHINWGRSMVVGWQSALIWVSLGVEVNQISFVKYPMNSSSTGFPGFLIGVNVSEDCFLLCAPVVD